MSLGPSGTIHLLDRIERIKDESRLAAACAREEVSPNIAGQSLSYFETAMRGFQQEQREQARNVIYPRQIVRRAIKQETLISYVEMELVGSHHFRPNVADRMLVSRKVEIPTAQDILIYFTITRSGN